MIKEKISRIKGRTFISGAPEGFDAFLLAQLAEKVKTLLFVARDDVAMVRLAEGLRFFGSNLEILQFPAWDCLPYDRVSPNGDLVSRRIDTLTRLLTENKDNRVVVTTVSALMQRVVPRESFSEKSLSATRGDRLNPETLIRFMDANGY
ncbi:MAG: transcription-repair coupling factor, partial [Rhodospirillales bacterium]|nr:transcription-repair coupling factor [Rhodospirillales bacterium]